MLKKNTRNVLCAILTICIISILFTGCGKKSLNDSFTDHRQGVPPDDGLYLAPVRIFYSWGYINQYGEMAIDPIYTSAKPFSENLALVTTDKGPMFIDKNGNEAFELKAQGAKPFSNGLASVRVNGKWGYINNKGEMVIQPKFSDAASFSEGFAVVSENGIKFGYIDLTGEYLIEPVFDLALPYSEGMAFVYPYHNGPESDNMNAYIGYDGQLMLQPDLNEYNYDIFSEGLSVIYNRQSMLDGYMNKQGEIVFEAKYEKALPFSEGLASVQDNSKCQYIDMKGNVVIADADLSYAGSFSEGIAAILVGDGWGFIDRQGRLLIDCEFHSVGNFSKVD